MECSKTGADCNGHPTQVSNECLKRRALITFRNVEYFCLLQIISAVDKVTYEPLGRDARAPLNTTEVKMMKIENLRT